MEKIIIEKEKAGKRIDIFISEQKQISRETAKRWIEQENVTINNKKVKPSYKTQENDIINIEPEEIKDIELKAQNIPLEVLYQDNDILVVNKPKGMVVHPANGNPDGTLVNAVMALCKDTLSGIGGELRPGIVHRLDKDTSGAIIIAKNDKSHIQLSEMLKNHEIEKTYIALVRGIVKENEATINMPISRSQNDRKKMAVNREGKNAITHIKVIERFYNHNVTLLEVKIETGRTHQIRVHALSLNHPLLGDPLYGPKNNKFGIKGQTLHARKLGFIHPTTNEYVEFNSELPKYFSDLISKMK